MISYLELGNFGPYSTLEICQRCKRACSDTEDDSRVLMWIVKQSRKMFEHQKRATPTLLQSPVGKSHPTTPHCAEAACKSIYRREFSLIVVFCPNNSKVKHATSSKAPKQVQMMFLVSRQGAAAQWKMHQVEKDG